jgi:hypothetical protein
VPWLDGTDVSRVRLPRPLPVPWLEVECDEVQLGSGYGGVEGATVGFGRAALPE